MSFATVDVLGVPIACVSTHDILGLVSVWAANPHPRTITYVNAHCLNVAAATPAYHAVLQQADLVYPDGISVVWASRVLGAQGMQKSTGADWIDWFCRLAVRHGWRIYIIAGKPDIARRARDNLLTRMPDLQIVGVCDGYFQMHSEASVLAEIRQTRPHVVFVGMGTPRQELWVAEHRRALAAPICWSVGALFDYVAGAEPRAPAWMNALALEWLWRLLVDPRGKWKRYVLGNPLFVWRFGRQLFSNR